MGGRGPKLCEALLVKVVGLVGTVWHWVWGWLVVVTGRVVVWGVVTNHGVHLIV